MLVGASLRADEALDNFRPFLKSYCYDCHGPEKQKNDLRFDTLGTDLSNREILGTWQDLLDQLNLGEMPPKKAKSHPSREETRAAIAALSSILKSEYAKRRSTNRETVIRRLNRFELRNTVRDLLYLNGPEFRVGNVSKLVDNNGNGSVANTSADPFRHFPDDEAEEGFDNIGDRLVMSDFFLKLMLGAAEESLAMATALEQKPATEIRQLTPPLTKDPRNCGGDLGVFQRQLGQGYDAIYQRYERFGRLRPDAFRQGVGTSARYRITIEASAHNQTHPWGEILKTNQDAPHQLGLHLVNHRQEHDSTPLKQWDLPSDGKVRTFTIEAWIDKGWLPWLGWENGPYHRDMRPDLLVQKSKPELFRTAPDKGKDKEAHQTWREEMVMGLLQPRYEGPSIHVHSLTLEPLIGEWPPKSHTSLYGTGPVAEADVEALLLAFAKRAFRRPVTAEEIARYVTLARSLMPKAEQTAAGNPQTAQAVNALQAGYAAILCSPQFLYLKESAGRLNNYEIASRLSYFLWSSMPDEVLLARARAGKLTQGAVLAQEVDRMLADPKAAAFTRHFTERWLRLDKISDSPPERSGPFRVYWDRQFEPHLLAQTDAFFADLVRNNGPIRNLISSDYTFLNEPIATIFYKRDDVLGDFLRKVPTNDPRRGGILTQPSVMTATANGVDTSPVARGVFVLENILGTPPSPPPPDVEPLSPDLRGALTIREQLERHREVASCNNCHRKIDPMGFAFENFNPVGWWREKYRDTKKEIDPSATLSNGDELPDIVALKKYLLSREDQVARCLTEKLLTYASGRVLEPGDRGEVDRIVDAARAKGNGLRDLITLVAQSEIFLTK